MSQLPAWMTCRTGVLAVSLLSATVALLAGQMGYAQELVVYEFTGVVADNSGKLGVFGVSPEINDPFSGHFSYVIGPTNPDQQMNDPELGVYNLTDFVIDQAVVSITPTGVGVTHRPGLPTLPPATPDLGIDGIRVAGTFLFGQELKSVSLQLAAPYQSVFTSDELVADLTLSDFTDLQAVISVRSLGIGPGGTSQIDGGQLTSLVRVPEPSAAVLILAGILGLGTIPAARRTRR